MKIIFSGDLAPVGRVETLLTAGQTSMVFGEVIPLFQQAGFVVANLECPVCGSDKSIVKSGPHLKANPAVIKAIREAGIGVVSLANNHIRDFGDDGVKETLDNCHINNILIVGAGKNNDDASKPIILEKDGIRTALISSCEEEFSASAQNRAGANIFNPYTFFSSIKQLKAEVDFIISIFHGGTEGYPLPDPEMVQICRFMIAAGADAVICHHSHCFSGNETWNEKPIYYGLGNFVFDDAEMTGKEWNTGILAEITLGQGHIETVNHFISQHDYNRGIILLSGEDLTDAQHKFKNLSQTIANHELLEKEWNRFAGKNAYGYFKNIIKPGIFRKILYKFGLADYKKFPATKVANTLNLLRCRSHNRLAVKTLENILNHDH